MPGRPQYSRSGQFISLDAFEDAVQYESSLALGLDMIVTRNLSDYANAVMKVLSPAAFLSQLASPADNTQ